MKYLDEYRDATAAREVAEAIRESTTREWNIMEICGGQTHAIVKFGLDQMLPDSLNLIHGPGCPVCVTSMERIDQALDIAARPEVIFCSFGDMLRVPGTDRDLLSVRAEGGDVRMVYSPLKAVELARANPNRKVVFFGVGFETTAPTTALAVAHAAAAQLENFYILVSHVLVPPAMEALLSSENSRLHGFLAAGHVCAVMGYEEYFPIARRFRVPIVVTGFEPLDILQGIHRCVRQLENGRAEVENQYRRCVNQAGNRSAQKIMRQVFKTTDQNWRGIGVIPGSGLALREPYARFDAHTEFQPQTAATTARSECQGGEVLQGALKPDRCPAFGSRCTPEHPLGAPMVSSEGACAAYYRYRPSDAVATPASTSHG